MKIGTDQASEFEVGQPAGAPRTYLPLESSQKTIVVVMPAFNAAKTIVQTYEEALRSEVVDKIVIVDDGSTDDTVHLATSLRGPKVVYHHERNRGYGSNQKSCYRIALDLGADIIVMIHADYQYTPRLLPAFVSMLRSGYFDVVIGSRLIGGTINRREMPRWRYLGSRALTSIQNIICGETLSEYHTGYRGYQRQVLEAIDFCGFSDDFLFDTQMLMEVLAHRFRIGELSCPAHYFPEASSMPFRKSVYYGLGCLREALKYRFARRPGKVSARSARIMRRDGS